MRVNDMVSNSFVEECPNCNEETASVCISTRPRRISIECWTCGYYLKSDEGMMDEEELEDFRKHMEV
tara:strand:+ start:814 stop:1014 length:201 start_codon:yes stop_codon:yes gene_type:complete